MSRAVSQQWSLGKLTRKRTDGSKYWSWCIIWWTDAGRKRVSLGTTDRVAAEAQARSLWSQMQTGQGDTVADFVAAYLDSPEATDVRRKREAWRKAGPYWGQLRPHQIDDETSRGYLRWRAKATNTMRNELATVRSALLWAAKKKLIDAAPKVIVPGIPDSSVSHLSKSEFRQFLTGCGMPHVTLFAMLAVTTGARKTALLELRWEQVDMDRRMVNLNPPGREQKGNKTRATVPLNDLIMPALVEAKAAALSDYVVEYRGDRLLDIKKGIAAAAVRSGIRCHPHMFRHSAAVWMAEDRVPMEEIAAFLGHKNINITIRVYARYHPDYLRRAASSLTW